jgi:hypothetical protein
MSDEKNKSKKNRIRYFAIAIVAIIILIALILLVWTYTEGDALNALNVFKEPEAFIRIDASGGIVYVYHEGGDPFDMDKMWVSIDGLIIPSEKLTLLSDAGTKFSPGDIIGIETTEHERPSTLILWYEGREGVRELARSGLTPQPTPTPVPTPVPTPQPTPEPPVEQTPSQEAGVVQLWPLSGPPVPTPTQLQTVITFEVSTASGDQPLTVQFRDTTQECIVDRLWEFGDGTEIATERFVSHKYVYPGTYMATLSIIFCNGYESPAAFKQIHVSPIAREDSYITGFRSATILPGGVLDFIVKSNVEIRVGGRLYLLQENDAVKIEIPSGGQGVITVMNNVIVDLTLPTSVLYVNGEEIARGNVARTNGITYSNLAVSDLSLHVSPGPSAEINGIVNGYNVISPNTEYGYFINNIGQDSTNKLILDAREQRFVLQSGIKGITQVTAG